VPEGRLVGQRIKLSPAQLEWMEMIYGSKTRTFILSIPRKNGKTAFSAMIVLLHLVGPEAVYNGQLYSTANSKDQAAVLFNLAARIVRLSPTLSEHVGIRDTNKHLYCTELGTVYKALSADSTTAMGMSPVLHISDESGQVRGPRNDLYEALETASAAQENPLTIVISTQASTDGDFLSIMIDDALTGADPTIKCKVYQVAKDDSPFDLDVLAKAQPNWHLMNHEEVFKMARDAERMPSKEAGFRNLVANQRVEANNPFITRSIWLENGEEPQELAG
jgi:phage terminase large subunit-like protein